MTRLQDESQVVLAAILDQSQDSLLLLDHTGRIEFMNATAKRAMNIEVEEPVVGRPSSTYWPEESHDKLAQGVDSAARGQQSRFELAAPSADGRPCWWDVRFAPIYDAAERLAHVLVTMGDVTEYVNRLMSNRRRREEAEREADFAEDIAREMRHRLKNQLAVLGAVARLLSRHCTTADELYEKLEDKLGALARAQDLLTIHREEPVKARDAISQVVDASGAGESIEVREIPDMRLGDNAVQHLALILGELQTNSLKYGALRNDQGGIVLSGYDAGEALGLNWQEDTGGTVVRPEITGAGTMLVNRLGSTPREKANVEWAEMGPSVTFYLRAAS